MFEGKILEVMESWPLQLIVQSGGQTLSISLADNTIVRRARTIVGPGVLAPGQGVRISTSSEDDQIAEEIDIL